MSDSDRPSGNSRPPNYLRQKRKGHPDAAYTRIDGYRIYLGLYGTEASHRKYAEVIGKQEAAKPSPTPTSPLTVSEVMAKYLVHVDEYYGHKSAGQVF